MPSAKSFLKATEFLSKTTKNDKKERVSQLVAVLNKYCLLRGSSFLAEMPKWETDKSQFLERVKREPFAFGTEELTQLGLLHDRYICLLESFEVVSEPIGEKLFQLYELEVRLGRAESHTDVSRLAGLSAKHKIIYRWIRGDFSPDNTDISEEILRKLETNFGLTSGSLVGFLSENRNKSEYKILGTNYSSKMSVRAKVSSKIKHLRLHETREDFYPKFAAQWRAFVDFKSDPLFSSDDVERNDKMLWRSVPPSMNEKHRNSWWCYNSSGRVSATADRNFRNLISFFSY